MKKQLLLLLMAVVGLYMVACQSQDATPSSDGDLEAIQVSAARTAADSTTKTKCKGKLTPIDSTALPSNVISYISTNYAGAQIKFAAKDSLGQYVVGIFVSNTHTGLLFDATGKFLQVVEKYGKKAKLTAVDISTLPASVTTYISTNYAGYTIKKAGTNADGNLFVGIANDTTRVVVVFDSAGNFVKVADIPPMNGGRGKGKGRGH